MKRHHIPPDFLYHRLRVGARLPLRKPAKGPPELLERVVFKDSPLCKKFEKELQKKQEFNVKG